MEAYTYREKLIGYLEKHVNENKTLFEDNPDGIFIIDRDGHFVYANSSWEWMLGYPTEAILDLNISDFFQDERTKVSQFFQKAFKGAVHNFDTYFRYLGGKKVYVNLTYIPISINDEVIGIYSVAKDISDLKNKKLENQKIQEIHNFLTENSLDIITKTELNGTLSYVSPACRNVLGYEPHELIGIFSGKLIHEDDVDDVVSNFQSLLKGNRFGTLLFRAKHKRGHYVWMEAHSSALINTESGKVEAVLSVIRDITERLQIQEMLLNSEKLTVAGQLAAGIAHEVRNPLTSIRGFIQLIEKLGGGYSEYYRIIYKEIDRINQILSELLTLAKPHDTHFKQHDLITLLEQVQILLGTQATMNDIVIELELPKEKSIIINCDENQLKQVFINFIKNSIEAMPSGGKITIIVLHEVDHVKLEFKDQGNGIPKELLERIGEPFFTTKKTGTGLGLMISKQIIDNHDGQFSIESSKNGTTIEVTLPLDRF